MYWVLHSHAGTEAEFYSWVPYMRHSDQGYWKVLREGMERIGCSTVLGFMDTCDRVYSELEQECF